jgi:hypothetical protein
METMRQAGERAGELPLLYCEPPDPMRSALTRFAAMRLRVQLEEMPSTISMLEQGPSGPADPEVLAEKEQIRLLRGFSRWGWLVPFSMLGDIMALAVRSWRGLTRWWGVPLLAGGLLSFVPVVLALMVGQPMLDQMVAEMDIPPVLNDVLLSVAKGLAGAILRAVAWHAALAAGAGLILLISGWILAARRPSQPVVEAEAEIPSEGPPSVPPAAPTAPPPVAPMPSAQGGQDDEEPTGMFG